MISVCMATYNGEKYIKEQLMSILNQIEKKDEIIISDDSSTDKTVNIIKSFTDNRIKLYENKKFDSLIFNFENAIKKAKGDLIVLADQDDIWKYNKITTINRTMNNDTISLKMYNGNCINNKGEIINNNLFDYIGVQEGLFSNIESNNFMGSNIVFSRKLLDIVLPFPKDIPMHDMWIGSCAYIFGEVEFVDKKIFSYRLHENNFTGGKTSLLQKIKWRIKLTKNLVIRYLNVKYYN